MTQTDLATWLESDQVKPPVARIPRILTRGRADALVKALDEGLKEDKAAEAAGVSLFDVDEWLERGEASSAGKYADFYRRFTTAQADSVARHGLGFRQVAVPLAYDPHDYQRQLHALQLCGDADYKRFVAACCGRRGGKTYGGAAHFSARVLLDLEQKLAGHGRWQGNPHHTWERGEGREPRPFLHYWVIAPTYALLDEPKMALQRTLGRVEEGGVIVHQTDRTWWLLGGVRVDFKSGDRPDRLVSVGLDGLWCDEAARLKPLVWRDNLRPTLSDKQGWALFTTTPLGKNWFWEDAWARGDEDAAEELAGMRDGTAEDILDPQFACISWRTADNTSIPELAEEMEIARRQMPDALFLRNYYASFEAFEGQCFDMSRTRHFRGGVAIHPNSLVRAWAGLDIGVSDHPSVVVVVGEDRNGRFHTLRTELRHKILPFHSDAWRMREEGNREYMANVIWGAITEAVGEGLWRKIPLYCPADNQDWAEYMSRAGFNVHRAYQSHEPAVTWASIAIHNDLLTIGDPVLWRCLVNLRYPSTGEHSTKLWIDKDDDAWDAMRYALSEVIGDVRHGKLPMPRPMPSVMRR